MNRQEIQRAIKAELERWPAITHEIGHGGKHPHVKLACQGRQRRIPFAGSPRSGAARVKAIADVRRACRELAGVRP